MISIANVLKNIGKVKMALILLCCFFIQSCDHFDLELKIINLSNHNYLVGTIGALCDTCAIRQDLDWSFFSKEHNLLMMDSLKANDSLYYRDKLFSGTQRIYAINIDSLKKHLKKDNAIQDIASKPWIKIFSGKVDLETKYCRIIVK